MFVDTNILVNALIHKAPHYEIAKEGLERRLRGPEPLCISSQIMREYLAVVTRPQSWPVPITHGEALDDIGHLDRAFEVLEDSLRVTEMLVSLCRALQVGGRQIHYANIVGHQGGPRGAPTARVQRRGLPALRRPHRTDGFVMPLLS